MNFPTAPHVDANRRSFLIRSLTGLGSAALAATCAGLARAGDEPRRPTEFQIACMTLPYARFPLNRALAGIRDAGYRYVAWGTSHREEDGKNAPVVAADAPPQNAAELAKRCRDLGLEPLMMFSTIYPEQENAVAVLSQRIRQASAAGVSQVLTFGHTEGGNRQLWIERFKLLAPIARDHHVQIVVKQHGGSTGTGAASPKSRGRSTTRRSKSITTPAT